MSRESARIKYRYEEVRGAYRYRAMHHAVLTPVLGNGWRAQARYGVCDALDKLRDLWAIRIQGLQAAGWEPAESRLAYTYLLNCPPFGVKTDRMDARSCKRSLICPFCYARNIVFEAFIYLEQVLYGTTDPRTPDGHIRRSLYPDMNLIEFKLPIGINAERLPPWNPASITLDHCKKLIDHMRFENGFHRRTEVRDLRVLAAAVSYKVYPKNSQMLGAYRCGVIITPDEGFPPKLAEYYALKGGTWTVRRTNKQDLCKAIVGAFAYPKQLMRAPAWEVVAMLNGLRRVHMFSLYGHNKLTAPLNKFKRRFCKGDHCE